MLASEQDETPFESRGSDGRIIIQALPTSPSPSHSAPLTWKSAVHADVRGPSQCITFGVAIVESLRSRLRDTMLA